MSRRLCFLSIIFFLLPTLVCQASDQTSPQATFQSYISFLKSRPVWSEANYNKILNFKTDCAVKKSKEETPLESRQFAYQAELSFAPIININGLQTNLTGGQIKIDSIAKSKSAASLFISIYDQNNKITHAGLVFLRLENKQWKIIAITTVLSGSKPKNKQGYLPKTPVDFGDKDGLSEATELLFGTDPKKPDTDGDGKSDYDEIINGTDPVQNISCSYIGKQVSSNYKKNQSLESVKTLRAFFNSASDGRQSNQSLARYYTARLITSLKEQKKENSMATLFGDEFARQVNMQIAISALIDQVKEHDKTSVIYYSQIKNKIKGKSLILLKKETGQWKIDALLTLDYGCVAKVTDPNFKGHVALCRGKDNDYLSQASSFSQGFMMIDSDGDQLNDYAEKAFGTDPYRVDTDKDGHSDYEEILAGYDPLITNQ
jgi:hypothetical protein